MITGLFPLTARGAYDNSRCTEFDKVQKSWAVVGSPAGCWESTGGCCGLLYVQPTSKNWRGKFWTGSKKPWGTKIFQFDWRPAPLLPQPSRHQLASWAPGKRRVLWHAVSDIDNRRFVVVWPPATIGWAPAKNGQKYMITLCNSPLKQHTTVHCHCTHV